MNDLATCAEQPRTGRFADTPLVLGDVWTAAWIERSRLAATR